MRGFSRKEASTVRTWGKLVISLRRMRKSPEKVMSSTKTGNVAEAGPLPTRILRATFGLDLLASWRGVRSETSLGVKETAQSMRTSSDSVFGNVRTLSTRGALFPRVNWVRRRESRNGGQFVLRT